MNSSRDCDSKFECSTSSLWSVRTRNFATSFYRDPVVVSLDSELRQSLRNQLAKDEYQFADRVQQEQIDNGGKSKKANDIEQDMELCLCRSVYISQIPQNLSEERLKSIFQQFGKVCCVSIIRQHFSFKLSDLLPCAYVHFCTCESANEAIAHSGSLMIENIKPIIEKSLRFDVLKNKRKMNCNGESSDESPVEDIDESIESEISCGKTESSSQYEALYIFKSGKFVATSKPTLDTANYQETRAIFAGNVPFDCTISEFKSTFARFGPIEATELPSYRSTGKLQGFGFVLFRRRESAKQVLEQRGYLNIGNRILMLEPSPSFERKINMQWTQ